MWKVKKFNLLIGHISSFLDSNVIGNFGLNRPLVTTLHLTGVFAITCYANRLQTFQSLMGIDIESIGGSPTRHKIFNIDQ